MTAGAGVLRSEASLEDALSAAEAIAAQVPAVDTPDWNAVGNLALVARSLVAAALAREESRGNHTRTDQPAMSDAFRLRLVLRS